MAEVLNLLQNVIYSALYILFVRLTFWASCAACMSSMSYIAARATKLEHLCNISELLAVHWLQDKSCVSARVHCVSTALATCEAVRS